MVARLLALLILVVPALTADAAQIQVGFRPQNGDVDTATEWAVEMISDTPIGSTGLLIPNVDPYSGFSAWPFTPVVGLPGVRATVNAVYDPTAPWGGHPGTWWWWPLPPGLVVNAGPGFLGADLGPVDTWLGMGMLYGVGAADIMAGEGVETGLWADAGGGGIPATDVAYTFPEPAALMLLGLGLIGVALLRR